MALVAPDIMASDNAALTLADQSQRLSALVAELDAILDGDYELRVAQNQGHALSAISDRVNTLITRVEAERAAKTRYRQELEDSTSRIELLNSTLRELSTPIMEVWRNVLCLPVIGTLDRLRSAHMMELLLSAIATRRAELAIIDITGIEELDAQTLEQLVNVARAIRLLGTDCVITGIRPAIAATLVTMGADTSAIRTMATLFDALAQHLKQASAARPPIR